MSSKRSMYVVGGAVALLVSAIAIRQLLNRPDIRTWLGQVADPRRRQTALDRYVDQASEDSFPASDSPSFTPATSLGHPN